MLCVGAWLAPALAWAATGACTAEAGPAAAAGGARYSVQDLVEQAARHHPSVAARQAAVQAAQADADAARSQLLPTPSLTLTPNAGGGTSTVYGLQQPLWAGGRLSAGVEAAQARLRSASQGVAESRQSLGFAVANAFQALVQARGRTEVWRELLARLDDYREVLQRRIAGGVSAPSEIELLQARRAQAAAQLKSACQAQSTVRHQLSTLTGVALGEADVDVGTRVPDLPDLTGLLSGSRQHSPTLDRLANDEQAARHDAEARAALLWPSLSLTVQRTVPHGVPFSAPANTVGVQLQFTPGAGLSSLAARRSAEAQVEAVRASREAAALELASRVRAEHDELQSALMRRDDVLTSIEATGKVLASYERLFAAGRRSWLDVLNAARELADAQMALADLDAQLTAGRYRLTLFEAESAWMRAAP